MSKLTSLRLIACQSKQHAERFVALGAPADRVEALGSIKFDVDLDDAHDAAVAQLRSDFGTDGGNVWLAGSTHPGEEEQVLAAHRAARASTDLRLLLVPRHPARAPDVLKLVTDAGLNGALQSSGRGLHEAEVVVCDIKTSS